MAEERRTPDEWLATSEFADIVVMDADGWDRANPDGANGWNTPLTLSEFSQRLMLCTIGPRRRLPSFGEIIASEPALLDLFGEEDA